MSGLDAVNNFVNNAGAEANQTVGRMASRAGMSTTTLLWFGLAVLVVIGIVVAVILMLNKGKKASPGANANTTTNNTTAPPPAIERVVEKVVEKEVERVVYVPGPTRDVVINRYMPSTVITTTAPKAPPPPQKTQPPGTFNIHFQGAKNVWRTQGYSALLDKYGRGVWMTFTLSNIKYRMKLNTAETTPIHNVTIQVWSAGNWIALDADNSMRTIKYSKNVRTATDNYLKITAAEPQTAPAGKPTGPKPTGPKPTGPKPTVKPTGPKPTAPAKAKGYWIKFANQVNVHVASEGYAALKDKYGEGMWLNFKAGTADFRLRFNKAKSKNVHNVTLQKKIGGTFVTLTDVASMSPLTAAPSNKAAKAFDVVVTSADRPDPVPAAAKPSTSTPVDEEPVDEEPADETPADTAGKSCKNGKTLDEFGSKCIDGPDLCASKGKVWSGKKCVCASGTSWDGSTCVSKSTGQSAAPVDQPAGGTKKKDCAVNKVWSDDKGQCMCTSDYKWDGRVCVLRSSGGGQPDNSNNGGGGPPPPDNSNNGGGGDECAQYNNRDSGGLLGSKTWSNDSSQYGRCCEKVVANPRYHACVFQENGMDKVVARNDTAPCVNNEKGCNFLKPFGDGYVYFEGWNKNERLFSNGTFNRTIGKDGNYKEASTITGYLVKTDPTPVISSIFPDPCKSFFGSVLVDGNCCDKESCICRAPGAIPDNKNFWYTESANHRDGACVDPKNKNPVVTNTSWTPLQCDQGWTRYDDNTCCANTECRCRKMSDKDKPGGGYFNTTLKHVNINGGKCGTAAAVVTPVNGSARPWGGNIRR